MEKYLKNTVNIISVELSGHVSRYIEPLCKTIQQMEENVFCEIINQLYELYCLLG
ncbi:hypothetical protein KPL35_12960 [Clostridium sp. CF011]|uniref:hypothetical protein n=1 Tax=Clostridium sp. CF011 TaxID=2843318 RepID=UPI001C0C72FC|nr:hypothetical protein [Clostridium sp. CF011]MBU3092982.1 hypothetical protein [Clostridium sp. CF011]WAG70348.1 hypothetical protein LL036_02575 [Clostridium sp. CF011]